MERDIWKKWTQFKILAAVHDIWILSAVDCRRNDTHELPEHRYQSGFSVFVVNQVAVNFNHVTLGEIYIL